MAIRTTKMSKLRFIEYIPPGDSCFKLSRPRHKRVSTKSCGFRRLGQWYECDNRHNHSNYLPLVPSYRWANIQESRCGASLSRFAPVQISQSIAERNHDRFFALAGERKFQVATVFDFAAELAKLIGDRTDEIPAMIRKCDIHIAT